MAIESFPSVQPVLGLNAADAINGHLDGESGGLWLRLEGDAARDALLFRAVHRHGGGAGSQRRSIPRVTRAVESFEDRSS
jgi:hypothetical protein